MMRRLHSTVFLLTLTLAACTAPPPPPDRFYRVEPPPPAARFVKPPLAGVLEVGRLTSDGAVAERALAFVTHENGPLGHYKYDLWSESPSVMIQDRLAQYLTLAGAAEKVVTPELQVPPDWILRGKVRRFEQLASGTQVVVEIQLAVTSARDGQLVLQDTYTAQVAAPSSSVEAAAAAFESGVSEVFVRFTADLGRARGIGR